MAMTVQNVLTYEQYVDKYQDQNFEFWDGQAIERSMPTWEHGILSGIIWMLLRNIGYKAAVEVELRIVDRTRPGPRPDVIASQTEKVKPGYPIHGLDVVVEVVSENDSYTHLKDKCRTYAAWQCREIYVVDPSDHSIQQWRNGSLTSVPNLATIPTEQIWQEYAKDVDESPDSDQPT